MRRRDGSQVETAEWRTGRNADLLRVLALQAGDPVSAERLVAALWPHSDEKRGRASLRTAVSQLRRVLGTEHIERRLDGLALRDAWVDVATFCALVREARRHVAAGSPARALRVARQADALYGGDLSAHDVCAEWATTERESLRETYRELLGLAAEAGLELRWMGDARSYATRLVRLDPFSERGCRVLMLANVGLGQTERALAAYHDCARLLADELGADPSPQTHAVYLQVLAAQEPPQGTGRVGTTIVGRDDVLHAVDSLLAQSARDRSVSVGAVTGAAGAGRTQVLDAVAARVEGDVVRVHAADLDADGPARALADAGASARERTGGARPAPAVVLVDDADAVDAHAMAALVDHLRGLRFPTLVLAAVTDAEPLSRVDEPVAWLPLESLDSGELTDLAADVLGGTPSSSLVRVLAAESGGRAGVATSLLTSWTTSGRLVSTTDGLALMPDAADREADDEGTARLLVRVRDALPSSWHGVLDIAAVLGSPVRPGVVARVLALSPVDVRAALERLADLSVLGIDDGVYHFRDPLLRDAAVAWLRPRARQLLHRRLAESGGLSPAERVEHRLASGDVTGAAEAALEGAENEIAAGRHAAARDLVRRCVPLVNGADSSRVGDLHRQVHEVSARLGMWPGAGYDVSGPDDATLELHRHVLDDLLPRRRVREAVTRTTGGEPGAPSAVGESAPAAFTALWGAVLTGESASVRAALESASAGGGPTAPGAVADDPRLLRALAWHDLGDPRFLGLWQELTGTCPDGVPGWLRLRIAAERRDTHVTELAAFTAEAARDGEGERPLDRHLMRLALAQGHVAVRQPAASAALLDECLAHREADGFVLLHPEAAFRLAALLAGSDPVRAADLVDQGLCAEGEVSHPRERVYKLLAQAAMRAVANRFDSAAQLAGTADMVARSAGLVFLRVDALTASADYLERAGRPERAAEAVRESVGIAVAAEADHLAAILRTGVRAPGSSPSPVGPRLALQVPRQRGARTREAATW